MNPWLTERGLRVMKIVLRSWDDGTWQYRLEYSTACRAFAIRGFRRARELARSEWWCPNHVAICLLRDHARQWLSAHGCWVEPITSGDGSRAWRAPTISLQKQFPDYDTALIEAVLAVEDK